MGALGKKLRRLEGGRALFWCPGCDEAHQVGPSWAFNGDGDKPTFSPSILVTGPSRFLNDEEHAIVMAGGKVELPQMRCHSFITDGRIQFLGDCTHELAGKTVDLPDFQGG